MTEESTIYNATWATDPPDVMAMIEHAKQLLDEPDDRPRNAEEAIAAGYPVYKVFGHLYVVDPLALDRFELAINIAETLEFAKHGEETSHQKTETGFTLHR